MQADFRVPIQTSLAVVGLDVGDRKTHYCILDLDGDLVVEGEVATREASLRVQFAGKGWMCIALGAGAHSPWISRLLVELGHDVIVANPRNVRVISRSDSKNDPADARLLARLAHVGSELLSPIQTSSQQTQVDLALVRARDVAVESRTKTHQHRARDCEVDGTSVAKILDSALRKAKDACPEGLQPPLLPLLTYFFSSLLD